ncbi:MAG: NapC/NirT family cytochrome c [Chloroflexota bacterium]
MSWRTPTASRQPNWRTLVIVAAGMVEVLLLVFGSIKALEFSDSSEFCGQLCHTVMTPEFKTYQVSPHSRVTCAQCHVGSGASYFVQSKVSGLPLVVATVFNTYERPIPTPVRNLRPARDTCEQCHWPQKFSEDRIRTYVRYLPDETNTKQESQMAFRVGGGEPGIARYIHWHVASKLWYLPLDEKNQEIAWVGVESDSGNLTEYFDPDRLDQATPQRIAEDKRFMDCLDCHNRATHIFRSPDEMVDEAIARGRIDATLPFIKKLGTEALDVTNPSLPVTLSKIAGIEKFYQQQYPQVYQQKQDQIRQAMATLQDLTQYVVFPEMRVTWQTHQDNVSHEGCFRCHGRLTTTPDNPGSNLVSSTCDNCHYTLSGEQAVTPKIPHTIEGTSDCLRCHGSGAFKAFPANHAGRGNETCSQCHSLSPNPRPLTGTRIPHRIEGRSDCLLCHASGSLKPFPADHAGRSNDTCVLCHRAAS